MELVKFRRAVIWDKEAREVGEVLEVSPRDAWALEASGDAVRIKSPEIVTRGEPPAPAGVPAGVPAAAAPAKKQSPK